jgi:hypothetical protein
MVLTTPDWSRSVLSVSNTQPEETMTETKIAKDGTVTHKGTVLGTVSKGTEETFASALVGAPERNVWVATDPTGYVVVSNARTRKDAIARLVKHSEPLIVTNVERKTDHWTGQEYVSARVSWQGNTAFVTRFAFESEWVVDSLFTAGSMMPVFSNGEASRVTRSNVLIGRYADAANRAAENI